MIATTWVISQSTVSFTKNKNPDAGEIDNQISVILIASIYLKSII